MDKTKSATDGIDMKLVADEKTRIAVPNALPGDVFAFESLGQNRFLLTKLPVRDSSQPRSAEEVLRVLDQWKPNSILPWEELREMTREG